MTFERWQQIQAVIHAALAVPDEDRAAWVSRACAGDADLKRAVELLLAHASDASEFLSTLTMAVAGDILGEKPSLIGRQFGRYKVRSLLGAGGMGDVYLGEDTLLHRPVALKVLREDGPPTLESRERLLQEARAVAALKLHPHIAAVLDVIEPVDDASTPPLIVMEYVSGEMLSERLRNGPLPVDDAVRFCKETADALMTAHKHGVVHRDLKPSNLRLTRDGHVKVLDFGLARRIAPTIDTSSLTIDRALETLSFQPVAGTPGYMSPEQALGRAVAPSTDIFSLGVVLFEMLTGKRPFSGRDFISSAVATITLPTPRVVDVVPGIAPVLDALVGRMLAKEPLERPRADEVLSDLDAWPRSARRRPLLARSLAMAAFLFAAIATSVLATSAPFRRALGFASLTSTPARPTVLAILPVDNPTGDEQAEYLGAGLGSIVSQNLGAIPGLTVLSRATTAPLQSKRDDAAAFKKELGADYVLDLMINASAPMSVVARLKPTSGTGTVWERTISGDALDVEKTLLLEMTKELQSRGIARRLSGADRSRINRVPTASNDALVKYSEARALVDNQDAGAGDRAIELLTKAVADDPRFAAAYGALADAYWFQYQRAKDPVLVTKATAAVEQALRLDPNQGAVYASLANMYQQTGRYGDAIRAARRAIELQPDSDDNHRLLGRVLMATSDYAAAADEMRTAIAIRPFWNNYFNLGLVEYLGGNYKAAADAYRRTIELNPDNAGGFQALGTVMHVLGDLPQAIGNYEHAVRLSPDVPSAHNNLGLAYYTAGRYTDALASFKQALALRPNSALYSRNIADAQRSLGNMAEAKSAYESAIRLSGASLKVNPRDVSALGLLAICEARVGRADDAERHVAEVLAIAPNNRDALLHAAQVHAVLNRSVVALRDLAAAIDRGYSPQMARMDDDLKPLRRLPDFETLVSADAATHARR